MKWVHSSVDASDTLSLRDQFVKHRYMDESQVTGMRFWKRTREGVKRDRGVGRSGAWEGTGRRESRIGRWDVDFEEARGLYRSDVFRLRTGPTPEAGSSERGGTGRRERSAISHGLLLVVAWVISGDVSKEAIQGKSSKACGWGVSRHSRVIARRRRLGDCGLVGMNFGRPWEDIVG